MKRSLLLALCLLGQSALAEEGKVYLLATFVLGGSSLAQSIFLNEPDITTLDGCREAVKQGQRDRDWMKYHHILRRDKMQGFTGEVQYRCVTSNLEIDSWGDRARYEHAYLVTVDAASVMSLRKTESLAACSSELRSVAAGLSVSQCVKSNQRILQ
ncbi:MAG: hypothetical protein AAAB13_13550 [Pseudomonas sp.]